MSLGDTWASHQLTPEQLSNERSVHAVSVMIPGPKGVFQDLSAKSFHGFCSQIQALSGSWSNSIPFQVHNQLMGISNSVLAKSIAMHLTSNFERAVFRAALQSFDQVENPLRVNNFATALRELGRNHLKAQAPDNRIKNAAGSSKNKMSSASQSSNAHSARNTRSKGNSLINS
jgi:hypothetical protein